MAVRITGIRKSNGNHFDPHEAINDYAWVNEDNSKVGITSRVDMVDFIENKNGTAYVGIGSSKVFCHIRTSPHGTKFLQTTTDAQWSNNLLSLPEVQ